MTSFSFPRSHRLTRSAELSVVLKEGKRARTKFLDVRAVASPLSHPRAGVVVPKQGRSIVSRNRVKRRLRELVRLHLLPRAEPIDFVIRARSEAYSASFEELRLDMVAAVERLSRALQPTE